MTEDEARKAIREGYYGDTLETDEIFGLIAQYFPEVDRDQELEQVVADVCFG